MSSQHYSFMPTFWSSAVFSTFSFNWGNMQSPLGPYIILSMWCLPADHVNCLPTLYKSATHSEGIHDELKKRCLLMGQSGQNAACSWAKVARCCLLMDQSSKMLPAHGPKWQNAACSWGQKWQNVVCLWAKVTKCCLLMGPKWQNAACSWAKVTKCCLLMGQSDEMLSAYGPKWHAACLWAKVTKCCLIHGPIPSNINTVCTDCTTCCCWSTRGQWEQLLYEHVTSQLTWA